MGGRSKPGLSHNLLEYYLGGKRRPPILKEEFGQDAAGHVTRYSLAYIDPESFAADNGRVPGYDNAHGHYHRHFMGVQSAYAFVSYEEVLDRFEREVSELSRGNGT